MWRLVMDIARVNSIKINTGILGTNKTQLGRWSISENERQKEIKSIWANSDNCGDQICGQPKIIKEITEIKKK